MQENPSEVIIIGGSIAGLSAAMTLGRSLRNVLIIDCGLPCNQYSPHSHNFITQDGSRPTEIISITKEQVLKYPTVSFLDDKVINVKRVFDGFIVETKTQKYRTEKVLFATGLKDIMPEIRGFAECWGISILHCPYCHGYEVRGEETAILATGEAAYHLGILLNNWTKDITILSNGPAELTAEQQKKLAGLNIIINEEEIAEIIHNNGYMKNVLFKNGESFEVGIWYASIPFRQQCNIAEELGCVMTESGHIKIDDEQRTTVEGVYAAGDNTEQPRAISVASASGTKAAFTINMELILK